MKTLRIFILFLLVGCQTTQTISKKGLEEISEERSWWPAKFYGKRTMIWTSEKKAFEISEADTSLNGKKDRFEVNGKIVWIDGLKMKNQEVLRLLEHSTYLSLQLSPGQLLQADIYAALGKQKGVALTLTFPPPRLASKVSDAIKGLKTNLRFLGLPDELDASVLDTLDLYGLFLGGTKISDKEILSISRLTKLRWLGFRGGEARAANAYEPLRSLKDLRWLDLYAVGVDNENIGFLHHYPKLILLDLRNTKIDNAAIKYIAELSSLKVLYLGGSVAIHDGSLAYLTKLRNLRFLSLKNTKVGIEGFQSLGKMTHLRDLFLSGKEVDGFGISYLKKLNLKSLGLSYPNLRNGDMEPIASFKDLRTLKIQSKLIDDRGLKHLRNLNKLQRLDLRYTQVSGLGLKYLRQSSSTLRELNLSHTSIDDGGLVSLRPFTQLNTLGLRYTRINDQGMVHLSKLVNLITLNLTATNITDAGLAHIKTLSSLETLDLSHTKISDSGLSHLKSLVALRWLSLDKTELSLEGVLNKLGELKLLYLLSMEGLKRSKGTSKGTSPLFKDFPSLIHLDISKIELTDADIIAQLSKHKGLVSLIVDAPSSTHQLLRMALPNTFIFEQSKPIILGSLPRDVIREVIYSNRLKIKTCYEQEILHKPDLHGLVKVKFTIAPSGKVISAKIEKSTMASKKMERCIIAQFLEMTFPEPKVKGIVIVKYPFTFK